MTDHRTTPNGTIDCDHHIRQGQTLRNEASRSFFAAMSGRLTGRAAFFRRPAANTRTSAGA